MRTATTPAPRLWLSVAILLVLAGCRDATAPLNAPSVVGDAVRYPSTPLGVCVLRQSPTAPPLETYQVSFWAHVGKASTVAVNYAPTTGQSVGQAFLRFDIPRTGLLAGAGGARLGMNDSVRITLTIDPVDFAIEFQPSGVLFSPRSPAKLTLRYDNADLDLNGNGVVDGWDRRQLQQLGFWYRTDRTSAWLRSPSRNDATQLIVVGAVFHFSEYAVSW